MKTIILLSMIFLLLPSTSFCNGSLTCVTPFSLPVEVHHVERNINLSVYDGVGLVEVEDIFHNPSQQNLEGVYSFDLPSEAFATGFWINTDETEWVKGEIKEITQARQIYKTITGRLIDPGILEQKGNLLSIRVFPVEPRKNVGIRFSYIFTGTSRGDEMRFELPVGLSHLSSRSQRGEPEFNFNLKADIVANQLITNTSTNLSNAKTSADNNKFTVAYSSNSILQDILISYKTKAADNISVSTFIDAQQNSYSLIRVQNLEFPEYKRNEQIAVIVDTSGSMGEINKNRAIEVISTIKQKLNAQLSIFKTVDDKLFQTNLDALKRHKFYGHTTWQGFRRFPGNNSFAGAIVITDGMNLQASHIDNLRHRLKQQPVFLLLTGNKNVDALKSDMQNSFRYNSDVSSQELLSALRRAIKLIATNPALRFAENRRAIPLFGSLFDTAYYILPIEDGEVAIETSDNVKFLEHSISASETKMNAPEWFDKLFAQMRIRQLESMPQTPQVIERITQIALDNDLTTNYTAFLAVPDEIAREHADVFNPGYLAMFAAPNFRRARASGRDRACMANIRVILGAIEMFGLDSNDLNDLEHDFKTGKFNMLALTENDYLRSVPMSPTEVCDYRILGDIQSDFIVLCVAHGTPSAPNTSVKQLVLDYCAKYGKDFYDFDFPYEIYGTANQHSSQLEYLLMPYQPLMLLLQLLL